MSKPLKFFLLAAFLSAAVPIPGFADAYGNPSMTPQGYGTAASKRPESYGGAITTKLGTGLSNLVLSPLEIPKNIINTTNEANLALGSTGGVAKGFLHMAGRFMAGIVDVMTFPLPTEPLTTPQFVWDNYGLETRYNPLFKMKKVQ